MRKILLALTLAACSAAVQAEIVTFEFSGTFSTMWQGANYDSRVNVTSLDVANGKVSLGDRFSGRFSFDTAVNPIVDTPVIYPSNKNPATPVSSVTIDGLGQTWSAPAGSVPVAVLSRMVWSTMSYERDLIFWPTMSEQPGPSAWLTLTSAGLSSWPSYQLPSSISLGEFSAAGFTLSWAADNGLRMLAGGNVTALSTVSAVPEPSTWMLLAGGIMLVGAAVRRARPSV